MFNFNKMPVSIITFFIIIVLIFVILGPKNSLSILTEESQDDAPYVLNTETLNIDNKKTLQYMGLMMDTENTLHATGGFYAPKEENPQTMHNIITNTDQKYKIVINADHGQYKVLPITKEIPQKAFISEIYGNMNIYHNGSKKDFNLHTYNGYKKDFDSPVIDGVFMSIIENDKAIVTVKGKITVDLNNDEKGKFIVYFGEPMKKKGGLVLGRNDIVKSGKIVLQYGKQVKKYTINKNLSSSDKNKLNALNFFTIH